MARRKIPYKKDYCATLKDIMAFGGSEVNFCCNVGITEEQFQQWLKDPRKKEFAEAFNAGLVMAHSFWQRELQAVASGEKRGNLNGIIYLMKCRFKGDWLKDGTNNTIEVTNKVADLSDEELRKQVEAKILKLAATKPMKLIKNKDLTPEGMTVDVGTDGL